jgi:hypothetical protein
MSAQRITRKPIRPAQVVFVHLPKTGGMSLHGAIAAALPPAATLRIGTDAEHAAFLAMDQAALAGCAFISGHMTLEEALPRAQPGARFVTLLRDPVERLLSAFNYMVTWPEHPRHAEFRDMGFAEFVRLSGVHLIGQACRQLTGAATAAQAIPLLEACYAAAATTARMPELAALIAAWQGVPPPAPRRENVTPGQGRIDLDTPTCALLVEATREDRLLFEHLQSRHDGLMIAPGLRA